MVLLYYFLLIPPLLLMGYYLLNDIRKLVIIGVIYLSFFINSLPWEFIPFNGVAIASMYFFIFLSYILLLLKKKLEFRWNIYLTLILLLLITMALNIGFEDPSNYGVQKVTLFFVKCVVPIITIYWLSPFNENEKKVIIITIIIGGMITSVKLLVFGDLTSQRVIFAETNPITIGREIGVGLIVSLITYFTTLKHKILAGKKLYESLLLLIMVVSIISLIFTGSRGPILAVVIGVLAGIVLSRISIDRKMRKIFPVIIICLSIVVLNIFDVNFETTSLTRIINQFENIGDNTSDQARILKFEHALEGYQSSPFIGMGTGKYFTISPLIREGDYPHNLILEVMAEQGLIGLIIMGLILISICIKIFKLYRNNNAYISILSALVIYSFINSMVSRDIPANSAFWISSILLWAFVANERKGETR